MLNGYGGICYANLQVPKPILDLLLRMDFDETITTTKVTLRNPPRSVPFQNPTKIVDRSRKRISWIFAKQSKTPLLLNDFDDLFTHHVVTFDKIL